MAGRTVSQEQLKVAQEMNDSGATIKQIKEATGLSVPSIYKYIRPSSGDPKPGGKRKAGGKQATDQQLVELFAKGATLPAIPMALWVQCDFCATHFATSGPEAAAHLVELSNSHPALRNVMEGIWRSWEEVAWAGVLAAWVGVPIAHHLTPNFAYPIAQMLLKLPPRTTAPPPGTNGSTPHVHTEPPTPFSGLDLESTLRMAESMGITIDPAVLEELRANATTATGTEEPPEANETAAVEAEEAQASEADTHTG